MEIELFAAPPEEQATFDNLYQFYVYDFTEYADWHVGDDGRFSNDDLHGCWTDPRRHPFFIVIDGRLAGLAIVDEGSSVNDDAHVTDMAEFFIMRRFRRRGAGREVARRLFAMFPGRWEVRQSPENAPARAFWRRIIGEYAPFEETPTAVGGTMQSFVTTGA